VISLYFQRLGWHTVCSRAPIPPGALQLCMAAFKEEHLVRVRVSRRPSGFRTAALLAVAVMLVPLPALAADQVAATHAPAQPLRTSIAKHASREALAASPKRAEKSAAQGAQRNAQSGGFFRSPAGIACLAVLGAGTGYALYSASHDRIHSVARDGQK